MHAANEGSEIVQAHRMAQAWQLADHIRASAERGRYVIAVSMGCLGLGFHSWLTGSCSFLQAGDFNSSPWSLPVAILKDYGCLLDSWVESHPPSLLQTEYPENAEEAIDLFGMTVDSPINSYSAGKPLSDTAKQWKGKRLDYIFYRGPDIARKRPLQWTFQREKGQHADHVDHEAGDADVLQQGEPIRSSMSKAPILTCESSRVVLTGLVPGQSFSYSDHFGLCSTFTVVPADPKKDPMVESDAPQNRPLPAFRANENTASNPLVSLDMDENAGDNRQGTFAAMPQPRSFNESTTKTQTVNAALQTLRSYTKLARKDAQLHLRLFAASIVFALALTISSAWQPKSWIQPIWTLLGVAAGAIGATMLYVGFVWGEWEQNLLLETVEQMELELRVSELEEKGERPLAR
jgi:sphingomyelin phosphodiesterase 2